MQNPLFSKESRARLADIGKLLYQVGPADPLTFAGVTVLLGGMAVLACWIPAQRAARIDPMEALRYE